MPENGKRKWAISGMAGGIGGAVEATVSYPAEFAKTQLQLQDAGTKGTMSGVLRETVRNEGVRGMYRGASVVVCCGVPKHGFRFGVHDATSHKVGSFIGGLLGGLAASLFVIIPQETVKTNLIKHPNRYKNGRSCFTDIYKNHGISGLYKGIVPTATKNMLNSAIRFPLQSFFVRAAPATSPGSWRESVVNGAAGVLAGFGSVAGTQPFDTIKTKMQGQATTPSLFTTIQATFRAGGLPAFYAGTVPRLLRVTPENVVLFSLFPILKRSIESTLEISQTVPDVQGEDRHLVRR